MNPEKQDVAWICQKLTSCDIYYELDWTYAARIDGLDCAYLELQNDDPCFGSVACACSNLYYRVLTGMPEQPVGFTGFAAGVDFSKPHEDDTSVTKAKLNDDNDGSTWIVIVVICSFIVFAIFIGICIHLVCQRKANQSISSTKTQIEPLA